jgi:hypothetical protein
MIDYGTKVVAGITPGKGGQRVHGIPVYDTIRQALRDHPAEAAVISVPPALVKGAVLEALENGITLAVVVSERVPRKDTIEFLEVAKARNARVIGPNTLGLISPGKVRLGMAGGPAADVRKAYMPGRGIASRSRGMTNRQPADRRASGRAPASGSEETRWWGQLPGLDPLFAEIRARWWCFSANPAGSSEKLSNGCGGKPSIPIIGFIAADL